MSDRLCWLPLVISGNWPNSQLRAVRFGSLVNSGNQSNNFTPDL
jgi:hypothetical protein